MLLSATCIAWRPDWTVKLNWWREHFLPTLKRPGARAKIFPLIPGAFIQTTKRWRKPKVDFPSASALTLSQS